MKTNAINSAPNAPKRVYPITIFDIVVKKSFTFETVSRAFRNWMLVLIQPFKTYSDGIRA